MTNLWIVIPVYGQWDLLDGALRSIAASADHAKNSVQTTVVVIDNGSPQSYPAKVLTLISQRNWFRIRNASNRGVTNPWNEGMVLALEQGADVVCICNSDVVFGINIIEACVQASVETGSVVFPLSLQGCTLPGNFAALNGIFAEARQPIANTGGFAAWCFFLLRKVIEQVGPFDEQFTLWYQDSQYHERLARQGFPPLEVRRCLLHHYESRTILSMPGAFDVNGWRAEDAKRWEKWTAWWKLKCADPNWKPSAKCYKPEMEMVQ